MKMNVSVKLNLHTKEAEDKVKEATKKALKDCVIDVANDAIHDSPFLTGNNRRRMAYQTPGTSQGITQEGSVDGEELKELEAAVYSTSGYGGFLETGTAKMEARPYIKPSGDRNFTAEKVAARIKHYLGES